MKLYWDARHDGPFGQPSLTPSAEEIANELEIARLLGKILRLRFSCGTWWSGWTLSLGSRNRGRTRPSPMISNLPLQCLNDAPDGAVGEARKLFKDRVRPCVSPKAASKRFKRARNVIISLEGTAICAALAAAKAKNTP